MLSLFIYLTVAAVGVVTWLVPTYSAAYLFDHYRVPDPCAVPLFIYVCIASLVSAIRLFRCGMKIGDDVMEFENYQRGQKRKREGK